MSTTFGIKVANKTVEVAHRHNIGKGKCQINILNPLLPLLPKSTPVEPLDNSAQGITNVGELIDAILGCS